MQKRVSVLSADQEAFGKMQDVFADRIVLDVCLSNGLEQREAEIVRGFFEDLRDDRVWCAAIELMHKQQHPF